MAKGLKYTPEQKDRAYQAYIAAPSIPRASKLCGIPVPTLRDWAKKEGWKEKKENDCKMLAATPINNEEFDKRITKFCEKFEIDSRYEETLQETAKIKKICFDAINCKGMDLDEVMSQKYGIYPKNFNDAMRALKTCWETEEKIYGKGYDESNDKSKPDIFAIVNHYEGDHHNRTGRQNEAIDVSTE
jgi:hypothetical protein